MDRPLSCFLLVALLSPALADAAYLDDWTRMKGITPRHYICTRAAQPVTIDGKLDDPAWQAAPWTADFVDIEGDAKPKPRLRTRAKMLWDEQYFYIAAELEEPHVWGTITNHDAVIFQDPDFEVFIDPDGDSHEYYEFEMNALNTGWDLRLTKPYKDGGSALNSWEIPDLKTAVHIQGTLNNPTDRDQGWTLEIAFPWKALGEFTRQPAPPREGDQWRVGFSRVEWLIEILDGKYRKVPGKKEDNWIWSAQGIIDMHRPEKWGYVQFTKLDSDKVKPLTDPSAEVRAVLQEIYYAQKDHQKTHKKWATNLTELALTRGLGAKLAQTPMLRATENGFQATAGIKLANGSIQRWHIRQDAKVWTE